MKEGCQHSFCPVYPECYEQDQLRNQAETGGFYDPKKTIAAGSYWEREVWTSFCARTEKDAIRQKCADIRGVRRVINELTNDKDKRAELI